MKACGYSNWVQAPVARWGVASRSAFSVQNIALYFTTISCRVVLPWWEFFTEAMENFRNTFCCKTLSFYHRTLSFRRRTLSFQNRTLSFHRRTLSFQNRTLSCRRRTLSFQNRTLSCRRRTLSFQNRTLSFHRRTLSCFFNELCFFSFLYKVFCRGSEVRTRNLKSQNNNTLWANVN
jgi:hypothetical protein